MSEGRPLNARARDDRQPVEPDRAAQAAGQSTADLQNQRDAADPAGLAARQHHLRAASNGDMLAVDAGRPRHPAARHHLAVRHHRRDARAELDLSRQHPADHAQRRRCHERSSAAGRSAPTCTLRDMHAADVPGRARRVFPHARDPVPGAGPDAVHRSLRQRAERRRAGAERLCRLLRDDPGEPGRAGEPVAGARRHQRRSPARRSGRRLGVHAQSGHGPAGFTGLVARVLDYTFGADAQSGVRAAGAGADRARPERQSHRPLQRNHARRAWSSAMVASQSQASGTAQSQLTTEQAVQTTLAGQGRRLSGVSVDDGDVDR